MVKKLTKKQMAELAAELEKAKKQRDRLYFLYSKLSSPTAGLITTTHLDLTKAGVREIIEEAGFDIKIDDSYDMAKTIADLYRVFNEMVILFQRGIHNIEKIVCGQVIEMKIMD